MAGALDLALAGPRVYGHDRVDDRFIGGSRREATSTDIRRALRLFRVASGLHLVVLLLLAAFLDLV